MNSYFRTLLYLALISLLSWSCRLRNNDMPLNLNFEQFNEPGHHPLGWKLGDSIANSGYTIAIDSSTVLEGRYSVSIAKSGPGSPSGVCTYTVPAIYAGDSVRLSGYIKTENVSSGYAGLWIRLNNRSAVLLSENMAGKGISGTTEWSQYSISIPYDAKNTTTISIGGMLVGNGRMWIDDLSLTINGIDVAMAKPRSSNVYKAVLDTAYDSSSQVTAIPLNRDKIEMLTNLGMVWGFLKYYHPKVASGNYNWDAALFRLLPKVLKAPNKAAAYEIIERWVDAIGPVEKCNDCIPVGVGNNQVKLQPDFRHLFAAGNLPNSLIKKLRFFRDNYKYPGRHYYISFMSTQNPIFKNELAYDSMPYPDAGIRLLSLYRYWNIIQYFYPYKNLIQEDWHHMLALFIPKFVQARNAAEYTLACLELIAKIQDTHAGIWNRNKTLDSLKGNMTLPFLARFVEHKLVVTDFYTSIAISKPDLSKGDIVEAINSVPTDDLIKKYLPLTPASNYETQLREMVSTNGFLLRSNETAIRLTIRRSHKVKQITVNCIPVAVANEASALKKFSRKSFQLLTDNIGYIYPARLQTKSIDTIKKVLKATKGIVIDLRCYPSLFMPFVYGDWLKNGSSPFAKFSIPNATQPGTFSYTDLVFNGAENNDAYKGQVVLLVDETTQSQAEYTVMALSTVPKAIVIGSTTAGADGNVSSIVLPGGIYSMISGLGVYYPDGTETQQKGVKIDRLVFPTVASIKAGKDEVLEQAIKFIVSGGKN